MPGSFCVALARPISNHGPGAHYAPGAPPSRPGGFPPVLELLQGKHEAELRYPRILLEKRPGTKFAYSGAGFMLLQHILELEHGGKPIASILAPWLEECGIEAHDLGFDQVNPAKGAKEVVTVAHGYRENGSLVRDTRLMFPPLAAGAHGSPTALCRFLYHLARAYRMPPGAKSGPIPHETAKAMLDGAVDLGAFDFMHSRMGLGLSHCGTELLHASPGGKLWISRCIVCFDGPDAGRGLCCCPMEITMQCL